MQLKRQLTRLSINLTRKLGSLFVLLILLEFSSSAEIKINYDEHVRPVFADRCLTCHNPDKAKGGLDLTTYSSTMQGGSSGEIVTSGDPGSSRLFLSVTHTEEPNMPPKGDKLAQAKLDLISTWITGGLLESSGSEAKAAKPSFNMALAKTPSGKPDGPPPMPEHLPLEPAATSSHAASPADIASSPWAPLFAIAVPKQVLLYNSENLQLVGILPFPEGTPNTLAFSRNGSILIAGGGRGGKSGLVIGWDIRSGKRVFQIGAEYDAVMAADITSDHSLVALGSPGRRIKIYSTKNGEEIANIKKHTDWVTSLSFSPDGVLLATGDRNGGLFVWESSTGNPFYTLKAHSKSITAISWRADSNVVASASEDGSVRLWEMNEGKQVKNWSGHGGGVLDLAFTGDGRIASCGRDRLAKVWDGNGTQKIATEPFPDISVATCLTQDGARLVAADWNGTVKIFNTADGKPIGEVLGNPPSITTRIARAKESVNDTMAKLKESKTDHAEKLASAEATLKKFNAAENALKESERIQLELTASLKSLKESLTKSVKDRDNATNNTKSSAETANALSTQVANTIEDPEKLSALKTSLEQANALVTQHQSELETKQAAVTELELSITATQNKVNVAVTATKTAAANAKSVEEENTKSHETTAATLTSVQATQTAYDAAAAKQRYWEAEAFNLERHHQAKDRDPLTQQLQSVTLISEEAQRTRISAAAATKSAEEELADTKKIISKNESALAAASAKIPMLKGRLILEKLIVDHRKLTAEAIRHAMTDAPKEIKTEFEMAFAEESKSLNAAQTKASQTQDLVENSVNRAQTALAEAIKKSEATQKILVSRKSEEMTAIKKLNQAEKLKQEAADRLAKFDKALAEMFNRYIAMLPKKL